MLSTSQKHRNFVNEPMREKPVTELAGIGPVYGKRLNDAGFNKAYVVLGQYLFLKKDYVRFTNWLQITCGVNQRWAKACYQCLFEWCENFL